MRLLKVLAWPIAIIYGIGVSIRNRLYNHRILSSTDYQIATISIGNLSTGGTGKSPHVVYLTKLFKDRMEMAVLSRGYGRKSSGFVLAQDKHSYREIGDEPLQLFKRHPDVIVAVDEDRRRGIRKLTNDHPDLDLILLDDAHQHRSVKPGFSLILTDYNHLYTEDYLLPVGNLRETKKGAERADGIVVTKCPEDLKPIQRKIILKNIAPQMYQKVFFSYIRYSRFAPLTSIARGQQLELNPTMTVLLLTGIANPQSLLDYVGSFGCQIEHSRFRDHYAYNMQDISRIRKLFDNIASENKVVITTEKDAMRLEIEELKNELNTLPVYVAEIEVEFFPDDREEFHEKIIGYAEENRRKRRIHQAENS